jgi:protein gp37
MAEQTKIQWCDSTLNIQMGCEGCELSSKQGPARCYAEVMTDRYQGRNGWPDTFMKPKLFLERLIPALRWKDLTGTTRKDKPWLDSYPRLIFLNDMGDTFTQGLPEDWFCEVLPELAASKHQFLLLTKWPGRMAELSRKYPLPVNVWPGTSVTSNKTLFRAKQLIEVVGGGPVWISAEPMFERINWTADLAQILDWIIFGGESGKGAGQTDLHWISQGIEFCRYAGIVPFVKQLGSFTTIYQNKISFRDGHAGDWNEWPEQLKIRELPVTYPLKMKLSIDTKFFEHANNKESKPEGLGS